MADMDSELLAAKELLVAAEGRLVKAHMALMLAGATGLAQRAFEAAAETATVRIRVQRKAEGLCPESTGGQMTR